MPEISGYKVLPIRLTPNSSDHHVAYVREHFIRQVDPNKPKGRTLFLLNIPPYVSEENLKTFFTAKVGQVISVRFSEQPGREESQKWEQSCQFTLTRIPFVFKVAFVVFKNTESVSKALKLKSIDLFDESGNTLVVSGIERWKKNYLDSILKPSKIQPIIDDYMEAYDKREQKRLEDERNSAADNDGWVTVGKQGRNAGFEQKESVINRLEDKIERGRKNKELKNFYTFQIRESKMQNVISLRKKFEEDKNKIEMLKKRRRFKPF